MNFTNLILWSTSIIIGMAGVQHVDDIHRSILKAQAKLIYDSRTETWGSPSFLLKGSSSKARVSEATRKYNGPIDVKPPKARKKNIKRRAERLP